MKRINKLLSLILSVVIFASVLTGCNNPATPETTSVTTTTIETTEATTTETEQTTTQGPWFEFKPKVCSSFHEDVFGKAMCDSWFSLVDAVMAGEDTFDCPNGHVYLWMIAEFPNLCFPVLKEIIDTDEDVKIGEINGTAKFKYKIPKEEAAKKIAEFKELVEGIINEVIKPEYTDFEKALALYSYFSHTYTYDYDTFRKIENDEVVNYTSSYRLLTTKNGICCEISEAYSYLLMQVGIDACTFSTAKHEWSFIKLGGKYYHVDPTFALSDWDNLAYFLMNDKQRKDTDLYEQTKYDYVSIYNPEVEPDYSTNDDTYKVLWDYHMTSFDPSTKKIECYKYVGEGQETFTYDYS